MTSRALDIGDVFADPTRLSTEGRWIWQGDAKAELHRRNPPGETDPALALDYRFEAESQVHAAITFPEIPLPGPPALLRMDVYGDGSGNLLKAAFRDNLDHVYELCAGAVDWTGWRTVTFPRPTNPQRFALTSVADAGIACTQMQRQGEPIEEPSAPLRLFQIKLVWAIDRSAPETVRLAGQIEDEVVRGKAAAQAGCIFVRGLHVEVEADALDGLLPSLSTDRVGNLFFADGSLACAHASQPGCDETGIRLLHPEYVVEARLVNLVPERRQVSCRLEVKDSDGTVHPQEPVETRVPASAETSVRMPLSDLAPGWYQVTATFSAGSAERRARTAIAVLTGSPPPMAARNGFFGMNVYGGRDGVQDNLARMEICDRIGVSVVRSGMRQFQVNPAKDVFDFRFLEEELGYVRLFGFRKRNLLLHDGAPWCAETGGTGGWRPTPEAYARYVAEIVREYGDEIEILDIWNEPNLEGFWRGPPDPVGYRKLLRAAYAAAKGVNPKVRIFGPGMSGPYSPMDPDGKDFRFLRTVLEDGGYDCLDGVSVHPYTWMQPGNEDCLPSTLDAAVDLMREFGRPKPVLLSEVGASCPLTWSGYSYADQAAYTARYLLHCFGHPSVESVWWFILTEFGPWQEDYGLMMDSKELVPRPSLLAYRTVASELGDAVQREAVIRDDREHELVRANDPHGGGGQARKVRNAVFAYRFTGPRGQVVAAWCSRPNAAIEIRTDTGVCEAIDILGRRREQKDGKLPLTELPVLCRAQKIDVQRAGTPRVTSA